MPDDGPGETAELAKHWPCKYGYLSSNLRTHGKQSAGGYVCHPNAETGEPPNAYGRVSLAYYIRGGTKTPHLKYSER